jgi:hypothetical protein
MWFNRIFIAIFYIIAIIGFCIAISIIFSQCKKESNPKPVAVKKFYRLKQVDKDGKSTYSNIVTNGK